MYPLEFHRRNSHSAGRSLERHGYLKQTSTIVQCGAGGSCGTFCERVRQD
jgi:hypothetical protein